MTGGLGFTGMGIGNHKNNLTKIGRRDTYSSQKEYPIPENESKKKLSKAQINRLMIAKKALANRFNTLKVVLKLLMLLVVLTYLVLFFAN